MAYDDSVVVVAVQTRAAVVNRTCDPVTIERTAVALRSGCVAGGACVVAEWAVYSALVGVGGTQALARNECPRQTAGSAGA